MLSSKNILIISPSWVGDFVIAQSLLHQLKNCHPNSKITVFAGTWARDLASRMPEIDHFLENHFAHGSVQFKKRYAIAKYLQANKYTHVYVLPMSLKSALIPWMASIPHRIGFLGELRYGLLNQHYKLNKNDLPRMVDRFAALANNGEMIPELKYPTLSIDFNNRNKLLAQFHDTANLVFLCPAVEYGPSKQWPADHFATLAKILIKKGFSVVLLGAKKDTPIGLQIENQLQPNTINNNMEQESEQLRQQFYNLIGKTSLLDVIDLMSAAKTVVANDSGLLHIAAASFRGYQQACNSDTLHSNIYNNTLDNKLQQHVNTISQKIIAIYGSIPPTIAPALYDNTTIVYLGLECSPCGSRTCKFGHYNCMKQILPQNIADMI